jgi:hypothetical protein
MDERRALLVVWIGGVWAAFAAARLDQIYPHYLVITYPVSFVLIAIALEDLSRAAARGRPALAASLPAAMVAGLCLTYVAFNLAFFRFVAGQGGTAGDYGVAYRHKAALASFVRDQGIVMMGAPPELEHLVRLGARRAAPSGDPAGVAEPPLRVLVVHDSFRGAFACSPEREVRFGPLLGCLQP